MAQAHVIDQQVDCQLEPIEITYESGGAVLGYFLAHCSHIALCVSMTALEQYSWHFKLHKLHVTVKLVGLSFFQQYSPAQQKDFSGDAQL